VRILVLGAGATGGYFGGRLAEAGTDVTFLVRERRRDQLERDGLRIDSPYGDVAIPVKTVVAADLRPVHDAVLLTCKAYDLDGAIAAVGPGIATDGFVLPVLNGLAHIARLRAVFGDRRVLGGTARIQSTLTPAGVVKQFNDWNTLTLGELDGRMTDRVRTFAGLLAASKGVQVRAVTDILGQLWEKLVHLSTAATLTALMRANIGEIVRTPEGGAMLLRLLDFNAEIAARNGHAPSPAFLETYRKVFSQADSTYSTSLLRDIERGAPTEGDHIVGFMLREARRLGLDDTLLAIAHTHIMAYEARRAAGRLS
jgi:2-dehydropantoate 2-reductase